MLFLLFGAGASASCRADDLPQVAVVSFTIAPGEPGAPTETLTVARRGGERTLTVHRNGPGLKPKEQEETVPLSDREFETVWEVVLRQKLTEFEPEENPKRVFDYGSRTLKIETAVDSKTATKVHKAVWKRPIKDSNRVDALVKILVKLSRKHSRKVKPEFFPSVPDSDGESDR